MKIGIVSDSHGNAGRLRQAVSELLSENADVIVHCGDLCTREHLQMLGKLPVPVTLAVGNMDRRLHRLAADATLDGVEVCPQFAQVKLEDGRFLAAVHGDREMVLDQLIAGGQFPYVCHGHTHRRRDERIGETRVINPGALHHPRGGQAPSFAILDTHADRLEYRELQ